MSLSYTVFDFRVSVWHTTEDILKHQELHALFFANSVWILLRPTGWDVANGLSSLAEKTIARKSNHL